MRWLLVKHARPGMVLARPVSAEGRTLLAPGVVLTARVLHRLEELGISTLYVREPGDVDPKVVAEATEVVSERTRGQAYQAVQQYMTRLKAGLVNPVQEGRRLSLVVRQIVDEVLANRDVILQLADIRAVEGYLFSHSVGVAVTASFLGIHLGLDHRSLVGLCLGALLHDVGKVRIADALWNKPTQLSPGEFQEIQRHTVYGFDILRRNPAFDRRAAHVAYQHHERWDGSGYPRGLTGEKIHLWARVVAVVDVFDALTTDRVYRPARPVHQVLGYIEAEAGRSFDPTVVRTFLARVAPYPVGSRVRLNTGQVGRVVRLNDGVPARPVVQLATGEEVNLKTDLARRIVGLAEEEPPGGRLLPGSRDEARPFGPADRSGPSAEPRSLGSSPEGPRDA